jgi:hypothetical protein
MSADNPHAATAWHAADTAPEDTPVRILVRNCTGIYKAPFLAVLRRGKWYHAEKKHELTEVTVVQWSK